MIKLIVLSVLLNPEFSEFLLLGIPNSELQIEARRRGGKGNKKRKRGGNGLR